jgi:Rps23 Pro-64 3,4-dihydroxylase Tpa1-like proline 4-hydroxylase
MKIIDDFLPEKFQDFLFKSFTDTNFPWYLNDGTILTAEKRAPLLDSKTYDNCQFTHTFVRDGQATSNAWSSLASIAQYLIMREDLGELDIFKVKLNLTTPNHNYPNDHHYPAHVDVTNEDTTPAEGYTAIYYVNDSDGDTIFFKDRTDLNIDFEEIARVTPKKGRVVLFDTKTFHAGQAPINTQTRLVLNMNFLKKA